MNSVVLFAISSHGLGHLGQTAPIINALARRFPEVHIVISSDASSDTLRQFIEAPFSRCELPRHPTVIMDGPLRVKVGETIREFTLWHECYAQHLAEFRSVLKRLRPNLVVTNIDYTVIDGARELDIPAIALCSLNWADILSPLIKSGEDSQLYQSILSSYKNSNRFIQLRPHTPMPNLNNTVSIDPVARLGRFRREEIKNVLSLESDEQLVLFSLGGIPLYTQAFDWNVPERSRWIIPDHMINSDPRFSPLSKLRMPFIDVLASCDVLITKPGYGSFVESYFNDTKVISVRREQWAESHTLIEWLIFNNLGAEMASEDLYKGDFRSAFEKLPPTAKSPESFSVGVNSAIHEIKQLL